MKNSLIEKSVFSAINCLLIVQVLIVQEAIALQCRTGAKSKITRTITVSQHGHGHGQFSKVQDAINSIPSGNDQWIRIYVNPGEYWEQVKIPYDKECIVLEGHTLSDTKIAFNAHERTDTSATFTSEADNFVAKNINFMNLYNWELLGHSKDEKPGVQVKQAVAAVVYGDKSAFYNCAFIGYQDTIWDAAGRHFYKSCYIHGAIDFIWGDGQSYFEDCNINVCGDGYITAQGRSSPDSTTGFVFNRGAVTGSGHTYLGRAYGPYSRVIFQYTQLSNIIDPEGWDAWSLDGQEHKFTYAEVKCTGEGANKLKRVKWEKSIDNDHSELNKYTRHEFVDKDNWIDQQPWEM